MGLFSTVLHLCKKSQADIIAALSNELNQNRGLTVLPGFEVSNENFQTLLDNEVEGKAGIFYLISHLHGNWATIVEVNVNIDEPFYLYELTNSLSKLLDCYALSFHLHDTDVLYYNLAAHGESLDGYNSNYQYFLEERASRAEILSQRHQPQNFLAVLPHSKSIEELNKILNEGYWNAFDKDDLDKDGVPNDDNDLFVDEQDRFERIGKYLEIYSKDAYPFADWVGNLVNSGVDGWYLFKAERSSL